MSCLLPCCLLKFLEHELKQSYTTKNFTVKSGLLDLEKQYRPHIRVDPVMAAFWADVSVLLVSGVSFVRLPIRQCICWSRVQPCTADPASSKHPTGCSQLSLCHSLCRSLFPDHHLVSAASAVPTLHSNGLVSCSIASGGLGRCGASQGTGAAANCAAVVAFSCGQDPWL
jgi:hypothetical protein